MAVVAKPEIIQDHVYFQQITNAIGTKDYLKVLTYIGAAVLSLLSFSLLFSLFVTKKLLTFGANLGASLSTRLFRYYMNQGWLFHSERNSAELTTRISAETYRTTQGIIQPLLNLVSKSVLALFIAASIFLLNPLVAIVGLLIFGTAYGTIYTLTKNKLKRNGEIISNVAVIRFRAMSEGFGSIKDTLLLNLQTKFADQFATNSQLVAKGQSENQFYSSAPRYIIELIAYGAIIGLVMYLIITRYGQLDQILPIISIYALAGFKLMPALQNIFFCITQIKANKAAFENIKEDLQRSDISIVQGNEAIS
ncbi:MAG: ABC transporter transmembrane domain-containing protein, partial [Cellvibrionales bacterium]|nr:ABC transporter transmembrane domain-containing protein [Cellvibrionales bacterium]